MKTTDNWTLKKLVGEHVYIEWYNSDNDWHHFVVIGIDINNGWVFLQGTEDNDGTAYTGGSIVVHLNDIALFEISI